MGCLQTIAGSFDYFETAATGMPLTRRRRGVPPTIRCDTSVATKVLIS